MQSLEARRNYKNSVVCAAKIVKDESILTLWSGAVPRLVRLVMSGGIVFTMYVWHRLLLEAVLTRPLLIGMKRLWKAWIR